MRRLHRSSAVQRVRLLQRCLQAGDSRRALRGQAWAGHWVAQPLCCRHLLSTEPLFYVHISYTTIITQDLQLGDVVTATSFNSRVTAGRLRCTVDLAAGRSPRCIVAAAAAQWRRLAGRPGVPSNAGRCCCGVGAPGLCLAVAAWLGGYKHSCVRDVPPQARARMWYELGITS